MTRHHEGVKRSHFMVTKLCDEVSKAAPRPKQENNMSLSSSSSFPLK